MELTKEEKIVLGKIYYNEGYGTQFTALAEATGISKFELGKILVGLREKKIVIERYRHSRSFLYINEVYEKKR